MKWELEFNVHWPHDRFALGWEYIGSSPEEAITTYTCYLTIITISFHVFDRD